MISGAISNHATLAYRNDVDARNAARQQAVGADRGAAKRVSRRLYRATGTPVVRLRPIKFRDRDHGFYRSVRRDVNRYFEETGKSKYANGLVAAKGALFGFLTLGSYGAIMSNAFSPGVLLLFAILFGASSLLLAINISHDAAHDALTPNRRFNRVVHTLIFTLLGANAYLWQMRHVKSHHTFPNVNGCDIDIDHNTFLRLSPNQPKRSYHRYQHLYAPFIFWLVDIHAVFYEDFVYLFKRRLANMVDIRHPLREYVLFFLAKFAYVGLVPIAPILVLDLPWWQVVLGWMIMSFVMSVTFISLLIGTHFAEEIAFPEADADGRIDGNWATHALVTSLDWNPTSKLANFFVGGANAHAAHHLFPTVCHAHYVDITRIIQKTAREFGVKYNETTLLRMVASHFRFLKRMGRDQ